MQTRSSAAVITLTTLVLATSACGQTHQASSSKNSGARATTPAQLPTKDPTRETEADLVIWCDNQRASVIADFANTFAEEQKIRVVVQVATDVRQAFTDATHVGKGPDIVVGPHDLVGPFVQNAVVTPVNLPPDTVRKFNPSAIAGATFGGQLYGTPYAVENIALVRNTDLAPDAPATVEDMVAQGKKIVADGRAKLPLIQAVGKVGDAYYIYPWMAAYGGGFFERKDNGEYDATRLAVSNPGSIKGADLLARMGREKVLSTNVAGENADALFDAGDAPFFITGPWSIDKAKKAGIKYAISNLPVAPGGESLKSLLGVQLFYVSAKARNSALAEEFVTSFVPRKETQIGLFQTGRRPPALTEAYEEIARRDPDVKAWHEAAHGGAPMPNIPAMNAVWGPLGQASADVISGAARPAERFAAAAAEISSAINRR
ncbi:carbohydrate ABC transporter substrate-binding protein, CUT1 family [Austwickia chelonae]|uniref:Putative ABC transporter substrate-binding protein n=1 Tax=Austwickia chelonae NBRC 105200 TaxID=1184607 RepID=K6VRB5_9MICO|nr:maltose ABC transporter substrate-binding protein [Austwickia chelonae]GAB77900.1 putative ABC transporter substrate-binding protein [Austwickia chelonae NBRC 105200]SEV91821.1 carbohydrate ABC transporter substrate-binding protein, CUT1 family [Austwickia chelonae]